MEMIVGILSMQRIVNYGSFLQAYALKKLLQKNGATEVCFIDIKPGEQLAGFGLPRRRSFVHKCLSLIMSGRLFPKMRDRKFAETLHAKFVREYYPMLELDKVNPAHFDLVVIGSDEVFNCCQTASWGYTSQLYGDIDDASEIISYAASFGHTTYKQLQEHHLTAELRTNLKRLSAISVRDENSCHIVDKIVGEVPLLHLDPVLIYDFKKEIAASTLPDLSDYILVYSYFGRINQDAEIDQIRRFAKANHKKIVSVYCRYDWCDRAVIPPTPFDVLNWFGHADFVVTDTFHGTIFSIITQRRFCTLIRDSNKQKLTSLLKQLKLEERAVDLQQQSIESLAAEIDYQPTLQIIDGERKRTQEYLRKYLKQL